MLRVIACRGRFLRSEVTVGHICKPAAEPRVSSIYGIFPHVRMVQDGALVPGDDIELVQQPQMSNTREKESIHEKTRHSSSFRANFRLTV